MAPVGRAAALPFALGLLAGMLIAATFFGRYKTERVGEAGGRASVYVIDRWTGRARLLSGTKELAVAPSDPPPPVTPWPTPAGALPLGYGPCDILVMQPDGLEPDWPATARSREQNGCSYAEFMKTREEWSRRTPAPPE